MRVYTSKDFFCKICSLQFDKKAVYDIHMSFVHKIATLIEEENEDLNQDINLENNTNLNSPIKKNIEVSINCSLCQANFSKKDYLKRHIEAVHERKPHKSARHVITKE